MRTTTYLMGSFRPRLRLEGHDSPGPVFIETDPIIWQLWSMSQIEGIIEVAVQGSTTFVTMEHGRELPILEFFRTEFRVTDAKPMRAGMPRMIGGKIFRRGEQEATLQDFVSSMEAGVGDIMTKLSAAFMPYYASYGTPNKRPTDSQLKEKQASLDECHTAGRNLQRFISQFKELMELE